MVEDFIQLSEEVQDAFLEERAVVALESTIITHGMPSPTNLDCARKVEACLRSMGAVPATIAILDGKVHIGLNDVQLERLSETKEAMKASRADLTFAISQNKTASTTVAATMILAHRAGIDVFATGGIGGVHRGANENFDISADLYELAQTPVIVVSAGAKAILDIPATLELLETLGVPVLGFQTSEFPAFWSRESGSKAPLRVDHVDEIIRFMKAHQALDFKSGILIANPIEEANAIPHSLIEVAIQAAMKKIQAEKIIGKTVTPVLLSDVVQATEGKALEANQSLILNNARLAAKIALALREEEKRPPVTLKPVP